MAVGGGHLGAVGVVIDHRQRADEAPHPGAEEGHHPGAQRPQRGGLVGVLAAAAFDHIEGEQGHHEEGHRLQRGEDGAPQLPVSRHAYPEIMVAGADDAGDQGHGDDQVQPFFDHLAVHPGHLDQNEGQHRAHDQFPHAFHPQVHHPPPVVLVQHQVVRVDEGEQEEHGQAPQAQHHHDADAGLAAGQQGHGQVVEEGQRHQHDAHFGDQRLFQITAAHGGQQVVAGEPGQLMVRQAQVAEYGQRAGHQKHPEGDDGQPRAVQFALALLRDQVVAGAHEAEQQPDDQEVGVHHARGAEGHGGKQEIADHVLQADDQTKHDLADEQADGGDEIGFGHGLRAVAHLRDGGGRAARRRGHGSVAHCVLQR